MAKKPNPREKEVGKLAWFRDRAQSAIALRSKNREFHGLEREFLLHREQMLLQFNQTRDIKHPRDLGTAREQILRSFLTDSGLIPNRYGISDKSVRVTSTSGHNSNEIDIAIYDKETSIRLMKRENIYEVFPIENIYGVIQVKSILTKKELLSGLKNLASFKRLKRVKKDINFYIGEKPSNSGFSILFAYDSELEWSAIVKELELCRKEIPNNLLPNAIFILNRGWLNFGTKNKYCFFNEDIESEDNIIIHGHPDIQDLCLYYFYDILMLLLRRTYIFSPEPQSYFRLPLISGDISYEYFGGAAMEIGNCKLHGAFTKHIAPDFLKKVVEWCKKSEQINWIKALDIAYGKPLNEESYIKQPEFVNIYNPDNLDYSKILLMDDIFNNTNTKILAYDMIYAENMSIYIPYYYSLAEDGIADCPECTKRKNKSK